MPQKEFEFINKMVIARHLYFYAVVAVSLADSGKWLKSVPSVQQSGQGFDLTMPIPVEIDALDCVRDILGIRLKVIWQPDADVEIRILQSNPGSSHWKAVSDRLERNLGQYEAEIAEHFLTDQASDER